MTRFIRLAIVLLISPFVFSQTKKYLLVLSKTEHQLLVLDYETLEPVAKIPVGDDPHEIVTSDDGSRAFISVPLMNNNGHEIDVVNLKTMQPEQTIDTQPFYIPHGLVYRQGKLWFTAQGSKAVCVYDIACGKVVSVFGTGQNFTHLIHLTPAGKSFYTTNVESGTVSIYEEKELPPYMPPTGVLPPNAKPRKEWVQTLIEVGAGAEGFDVSPDGKELWTCRPDGHIVIVDLFSKSVKADLTSGVEGLHRLKFTPDGKTVCVVSVKTGDLLCYDAGTHELKKKENIGRGAGIYMDAASNRMFISCTPDNKVIVVDINTTNVIHTLEIGRPDGITSVTVL